jgi:hypothetical protein
MSDDLECRLRKVLGPHRDALAKLAADPRSLELVMRQVRTDIAERVAARNAEIQRLEAAATAQKVMTAFCAKVTEFTDTLAKLNATLDRISRADEVRRISAAVAKGFRPNGHPDHLIFERLVAAHEAGLMVRK